MDNVKMVCPCLLGIEGLVANELKRINAENVKAENGRVFFEGSSDIMARANISVRTGERILVVLGEFFANTFDELFENVKKIPWDNWIGKKDRFPVKGRSLNSKLTSIPNCQKIIKKAIVEKLKSKYKINWFEETEHLYQIQFLIFKNKVSIMLDTSGLPLFKRGYRTNSVEAPIRETLAAAMAELSRVFPDTIVIDPFCGSGTILVESALLALNIAPGVQRHFAFEEWPQFELPVLKHEKERAVDSVRKETSFEAIGYDIDENAISLTIENAKRAGVISKIKAYKRDFREWEKSTERGTVITNPPYGEKLLDREQAAELYKVMGHLFTAEKNWKYSIISPEERFEDYFGRKADKRRKLYNGMIACQLYQYFKTND